MSPRTPTRMAVGLALMGACLLAAPDAHAADTPVRQATCSISAMVSDLRVAMKSGSPAYRRYVKDMLKLAARSMPIEELVETFNREQDPEVLEALASSLASRASFLEKPDTIAPVLDRALKDPSPNLRAAAIRGLRDIGSVDMLKQLNIASYEQLVRDPAPEVREAVAGNLVHENAETYYGHYRPAAEEAVLTAAASRDPAVAAKLLSEVSMEKVGHEAVQTLYQELRSDDVGLRAAAVKALGGVPGAEAPDAKNSLVDLYRREADPNVRKAILQAIVELGLSGSRPVLESLRGVDSTLAPEVDAWLAALRFNLQEWSLVLREKQRIRP